MINFLQETIEVFQDCGKTEQDVLWVGVRDYKMSWEQFKKHADFEYDNGYGVAIIESDLLVVGDDWWLERAEYDGSEWWEYKSYPQEPTELLLDEVIESFIKEEW